MIAMLEILTNDQWRLNRRKAIREKRLSLFS
jgi:hypothetical protein